MYEYQNAVPMGIDQVNTYHPMWTSGVVAGTLDGWTFLAGTSGNFTAVANAGSGQLQVTTSAPHGMSAGQIVALTSASDAGYQPPNPTIFKILSVTASTFNVTGTFTATATGTWTRGACIIAGAAAAGKYQIFWSASCQASSGSNKKYKFEPLLNTTNLNTAASEDLINSTGPQSQSASTVINVGVGDVVGLLCMNETDTTDLTVIHMNCRVIRYQQAPVGFTTQWTVAGDATARTITLPLVQSRAEGALAYNCVVNWGDGSPLSTVTSYNDVNSVHTYASNGTYNVTITGTCEGWSFNGSGDVLKITSVVNWGSSNYFNGFKYLKNGFKNCSNLTTLAPGPILASGTGILTDGFVYTFSATGITTVPVNLFDAHTSVTTSAFNNCFFNCASLATLPIDLFRYNTQASTFAFANTFSF